MQYSRWIVLHPPTAQARPRPSSPVPLYFHPRCSDFATVLSLFLWSCWSYLLISSPTGNNRGTETRQETLNLFVVFGVNTLEPQFVSTASTTGSGRALPGMETGGRGAEMKVVAKSSCSCSKPKSLQLFSGLTDFTTGLQSKTVHSQTVILHIPGFGAHTRLWSHRSAHEQKEKGFFFLFTPKTGPICTAGGTEMRHESFLLITLQTIWAIGLETQWKSEAKLVKQVIMAAGLKERVKWKNDLVVHSLHIVFLQRCLALKQSTRGENKCGFWYKHIAMNEMLNSFMPFQTNVSVIVQSEFWGQERGENFPNLHVAAFIWDKLSLNGTQRFWCTRMWACVLNDIGGNGIKQAQGQGNCLKACRSTWWMPSPKTDLQLFCQLFCFLPPLNYNTYVPLFVV